MRKSVLVFGVSAIAGNVQDGAATIGRGTGYRGAYRITGSPGL